MHEAILAIDQGTTSSRAIVFDGAGRVVSVAQQEFAQHFPREGWVEHDPEEIWQSICAVSRLALREAEAKGYHAVTVGITNQRETVVVWDAATGKPIYPAIVWQDRRTAEVCRGLRLEGCEPEVTAKTGLLMDPYFSATKIAWILEHVEGARERAERGELRCGTIDTFLIWRLTGGAVHATDATNASRTSLFDIHNQQWDEYLLSLFGVPRSMLADVRDSAADYGVTQEGSIGAALPIGGVVGDQQAALVGMHCFGAGMVKSTYGTGCFMMMNTGVVPVVSKCRLLTTVAYRLDGEVIYALEGSLFIAGAAVQWLRDALQLIVSAEDTGRLVLEAAEDSAVVYVPALAGLGAPHWEPNARGAFLGMTRDTGKPEMVKAVLEAMSFQTRDLLDAMVSDGGALQSIRVDGGMMANEWLVQAIADSVGVSVGRSDVLEATARGAAYLAGLQAGIYDSLDDISAQQAEYFWWKPEMEEAERDRLYARWKRAVEAVLLFAAT